MTKTRILLLLGMVFAFLSTAQLYADEAYNADELNRLKAYAATQTALNWDTEADPSAWLEVVWDNTVATNKRVVEISLTQKELEGHLDLSGFPSLTYVYLNENPLLTSLDVSGCENLETINCPVNGITTLNVSGCINLTYLYCYSNNLASLDLSDCENLVSLYCWNNALNELDLFNNNKIEVFGADPIPVYVTQYSATDISATSFGYDVRYVYVYDYSIFYYYDGVQDGSKTISGREYAGVTIAYTDKAEGGYELHSVTPASGSIEIQASNRGNEIHVYYVKASYAYTIEYYYDGILDTDKTIQGTELFGEFISYEDKRMEGYVLSELMPSSDIVITSNPEDNIIKVYYERIWNKYEYDALLEYAKTQTALNWSSEIDPLLWTGIAWTDNDYNNRVLDINLNVEGLTGSLNLSGFKYLTTLNLPESQIASLDVSGCESLWYLNCMNSNLTSLNLSGCENLILLNCNQNQLKELDLSDSAELQQLYCEDNKLTSLDVSMCVDYLYLVHCSNNQLESLNISGCTYLPEINCSGNLLAELDLSGMENLKGINCFDNKLESLNLTDCTDLSWLNCQNNQLETLDLSNCTSLEYLSCGDNKFKKINLTRNDLLTLILATDVVLYVTEGTVTDATAKLYQHPITYMAYDAEMVSITDPLSEINTTNAKTVTVKIKNNGYYPISNFELVLTVNGEEKAVETFTETLDVFEEKEYTFTQTVDLSTEGAYTFEVKATLSEDEDADNDTCSKNIHVIRGSGIEIPDAVVVDIYPNPVTAMLNIVYPWDRIDMLEIITTNGQMVKQLKDFREKTMDVSDLNNGIYLLKLIHGNTITVLKFSKK